MTRYAYDPARHQILAIWHDGRTDGELASVLVELDTHHPVVPRLAAALTSLSEAIWRTYTHPARPGIEPEPGSEDWRRASEQLRLATVLATIATPPHPGEIPEVSTYSPVGGWANWVAILLRQLGSAALTEVILEEVRSELGAVESARVGDLTGRSRQAAAMSTPCPAPSQAARAAHVLYEQPVAPDGIEDLEPSAVALAAIPHYLAALHVAARAAACTPAQVLGRLHADDTVDLELLYAVLQRSENQAPPQIVADLVREAQVTREGKVYDHEDLARYATRAERLVELYGCNPHETEVPLCTLDPHHPADHLRRSLLEAILACSLLWEEHAGERVDFESSFNGAYDITLDGDAAADLAEDDCDAVIARNEAAFAAAIRAQLAVLAFSR